MYYDLFSLILFFNLIHLFIYLLIKLFFEDVAFIIEMLGHIFIFIPLFLKEILMLCSFENLHWQVTTFFIQKLLTFGFIDDLF
jgi:hypothetical protein